MLTALLTTGSPLVRRALTFPPQLVKKNSANRVSRKSRSPILALPFAESAFCAREETTGKSRQAAAGMITVSSRAGFKDMDNAPNRILIFMKSSLAIAWLNVARAGATGAPFSLSRHGSKFARFTLLPDNPVKRRAVAGRDQQIGFVDGPNHLPVRIG